MLVDVCVADVARVASGVFILKLVIVNGTFGGGVEGVLITPKYTTLLRQCSVKYEPTLRQESYHQSNLDS